MAKSEILVMEGVGTNFWKGRSIHLRHHIDTG